jgi:cytochrome bd ubiquinol oxidase subunit II
VPTALAVITLLALGAYVLLGGADFGGGVWDLLASGPRRDRQRALIAHAIGPIWEANHVWLILVVVLLFTCFPPVFARLSIVLHVPLSLMLVGIVLRGIAFTLRSYGAVGDAEQRRWGTTFAIASAVTPVLLGICVGTVAAGRAGAPGGADWTAAYVRPWASPFPIAVGVLTLAAFAYLAATYLTVEATGEPDARDDTGLADDFRRRALWSGAAMLAAAGVALALSGDAPLVRAALGHPVRALPFHVALLSSSAAAAWALLTRRYRMARLAAGAQVSVLLGGWAWAQAPWLVPPDLSLANSAAPPITLRLTLIGLAIGSAVLAPSLWYLFRLFKGQRSAVAH